MSIVGTRPPLISETNLYEPRHKARLAIKPGITGMWQVSGRSDITDFEKVVRYQYCNEGIEPAIIATELRMRLEKFVRDAGINYVSLKYENSQVTICDS